MMTMRPKRQLIETSPAASVNTSSTSPSIASTVPMASPSVRRSARIQESPSINYSSLRSRGKETPIRQLGRRTSRSRSRSRIFGLDPTDQFGLDKHSDSEVEVDREEVNQPHSFIAYQKLFMDRILPVLTSPRGKGVAASLLLLLMLVFTQWVVGKGVVSLVTWSMGPISGLRMAMMTLPDMLMGVVSGRRDEFNEVELLDKLANSDKIKDLMEKRIEEKMLEMEKYLENKSKMEFEVVNKEVENMREMLLQSELKRLALREEELKLDKPIRQVEESDAAVPEVSQDMKKKIEFVELKVDQLKLNLVELAKQNKDKMTLGEEMVVMKGNVQDLLKERNKLNTIEEELKLLKDTLRTIENRLNSVAKIGEELGKTSSHSLETEGPNNLEEIKEVVKNLLELSLNQVYENVNAQQENVDQLVNQVGDLGLSMKMTNSSLADVSSEVASMKTDLKEELAGLTESLHISWSEKYLETSVSLPEVSDILHSELSLYSSDRTGLVDWASLSLGGSILSTPHTTTHPTTGQVLTILGIPVWHISSSPSQILRPVEGPGQCWAYSGQEGQVVIKLGKVVKVTGVTIEHVRPVPDMSSAPRDMLVWDHEGNTPLLNMTYTIDTASSSVQTFPLTTSVKLSKLRLHILSNWGHEEYTCLYRVRVHGVQVELDTDVDRTTGLDMSVDKM